MDLNRSEGFMDQEHPQPPPAKDDTSKPVPVRPVPPPVRTITFGFFGPREKKADKK
jgi:hypothetical protein